ncbi:hypothetical protein KSS87_014822 [Heliosperma pusillum]|nr:hypothetical protein KSS87_014822 [Heliosperma pusillum]
MSHLFLCLVCFLFIILPQSIASWPPSPGYFPSKKFRSIRFSQGYRNLWGPRHQKVDQHALTIWLDRTTGSGFKSVRPFRSGYFGTSIKLPPGYTAGVITAFYLSNSEAHPGFHDEVDMEFLGTTFGKPYVLQTNVYIRGSGDGNIIIGREMKFHLWFDPTKGFHHYAIFWSPKEIILVPAFYPDIQEKVMQRFHYGQCGSMDRYGTPRLGRQKMENTKPIIDINHSWLNTPISKQVVAPPTLHQGVGRFRPLPMAAVA